MRIAFASCMSTRVFADQPVWDWVAQAQPDHLVLLGDSVYLDVPILDKHPMNMSDDEFARHLYANYSELMAQPQFLALVRQLPAGRVWSVWDDHDFLWNDALGAEARANPAQREKVRLSTAFHEAFRAALATGLAAASFPDAYDRPEFWNPAQPPLASPSIELEPGLWLHLADDRSWRTRTWLLAESKRTLLGKAQRDRFGAAVAAQPGAIHLLASGSTLASWKRHYAKDWQWLNRLAAAQRMLVLSGDIHRNETDAFFTGGWPLHEATSSGAAVKDAVIVGQTRRNFGLLDVTPQAVQVTLYANHHAETHWGRTLNRATWLPV
jgi:alkaline phosphatase D